MGGSPRFQRVNLETPALLHVGDRALGKNGVESLTQ